MKKSKLFTLTVIALLLMADQSAHALKITFGTKCHPDGAGACVGERGICLIIEIKKNNSLARYADPSPFLGDDMAYGELTLQPGNLVRLDVLSQNSDVLLDDKFTLEDPIVLSEELSKELGFSEVTLLPGVYRVDYGSYRLGSIDMAVSLR